MIFQIVLPMRFLKSANKKQWRIHLEPAMRIPEEVIRL